MNYFLNLILCLYLCPGSECVSYTRSVESQQPAQGDAFQRGLAALKENRLEDALAEFTTAEHEHPEDARIHNFRGILLVQMGKNAEAAAADQDALRLDPLVADAHRNPGGLQWAEPQLGPARGALLGAVTLYQDVAGAR